ncbi:MAG: antitermination protein NusB [Clostridiaceae bacterium]|jgi:N utilization substance protein B|nr:antitermination protein NusB [Clostridiaceae bacterium]
MNRRKSRETAMKLLFQMTANKEEFKDVILNLKENSDKGDLNLNSLTGVNLEKDGEAIDIDDIDLVYITKLLKGIEENMESLDSEICKYLKNWKLNRLNKVDLCILRIGAYELLYSKDVPTAVCINEAVEMGKTYSDEKSASFINGVLDNLLKNSVK